VKEKPRERDEEAIETDAQSAGKETESLNTEKSVPKDPKSAVDKVEPNRDIDSERLPPRRLHRNQSSITNLGTNLA
jgi:hypothetical protein